MCLQSSTDDPQFQLLDTKLMVRRVRVESSVLTGHQIGLNKQNAIYPIRTKETVAYAIDKGSTSFYKEQIFGDRRLPNFLLVAFQNGDRYNESYSTSSTMFDHFNVKSISLSKNSDYRETYSRICK